MADSESIFKKPIAIRPSAKMGNGLHISWYLHNLCNNRCSYCDEHNYKGDVRWLKYDHVIGFLEQVLDKYAKKEFFHISFTGGEPTLWKDFQNLCRYLKNKNCELALTSNGTRDLKFWSDCSTYFNRVCLSYHPEFTNDDHFIEVIKCLMNKTRLAVRLMMHKEEKFWQRSIAFGNKLKDIENCSSVYVEYVPLQENFGSHSRPLVYEEWQQEFFSKKSFFTVETASEELNQEIIKNIFQKIRPVRDNEVVYSDGSVDVCRPNEMVAHNEVNFFGWKCFIGLDSLFIDHRGDVFRAGCLQGGKIANIFDKNITFPNAPAVCKKSFCPCGTDIVIKKEMEFQ